MKFYCTFFPSKTLALLSLLKKVKPSPDHKVRKLLTFDNLFSPLRHARKNSGSEMTSAITFSRQNDAGSSLSNAQY